MLVFRNSNRPVEEAGAILSSYFREGGAAPKLFLASGGSSLGILEHVTFATLGERVTISVLDERYSQDPSVNNFAQLSGTRFFAEAKKRGCSFIDTRPRQNESMEALAARFETSLKKWYKDHPDGRTIATIGIAENGHTAGIMPMGKSPDRFHDLFEKEGWVAAYSVSPDMDMFTQRVTTTLSFLREHVDVAVGFAVSESKRAILKHVLDETNTLPRLPARIMHQMKKVVIVSNVLDNT